MTFSRYIGIYRTCAYKKINIEKKKERACKNLPDPKINKKAKRKRVDGKNGIHC